ncbi:PREDICTED: beta-defensin 125 [Hipposideros armiger]|uniref:Beta-defensin n=1 Tax=Hipposideros armiger TaxID=186990 RepID=A0A8B7RJI9_HIPAR|nr:PREDICTED: beta-defensin 125 [Hipposideros armiger]
MNLLMLTFIICGLLTLVTKAGWGYQRCWKNNVGHCRRRCLHTERYKLLCMNKLNCCTPIKFDEYTRRPLLPPLPTDFTVNFNTWDVFPNSPITGISDEVTINKSEESFGHDSQDENFYTGFSHNSQDENFYTGFGHNSQDENFYTGFGHNSQDENFYTGFGHNSQDENFYTCFDFDFNFDTSS